MDKNTRTRVKKEEIIFKINPKIYPLESICLTAYTFIDKFYIFLDEVHGSIEVHLKAKQGLILDSAADKGKFMNELLNNVLRIMISKKNQKIREIIVKEALFFSQPKNEIDNFISSFENNKEEGWENDPLRISDTWEKKQKKTRG